MTKTSAAASPPLHFVTYVRRDAEPGAEPDVVAHGVIQPADPCNAWHPSSRAVASFERASGFAKEPVSRIDRPASYLRSDDVIDARARPGEVAIDWNPNGMRHVFGEAKPGDPFEVHRGGVTVRVEAREVGSAKAMAKLDAELEEQASRTALRESLREGLAIFNYDVSGAISNLSDRFLNLSASEGRGWRAHRSLIRNQILALRTGAEAKAQDLLGDRALTPEKVRAFEEELICRRDEIDVLCDNFRTLRPEGFNCKGQVVISAERNATGKLTHWNVRFKNTGEQPWIGTITFVESDKNEGIGFESMALPGKSCGALQRIEAGEDYGVSAKPKQVLRLAVRGHSHLEIPLPAKGELLLRTQDFKVETSDSSARYFDAREVRAKRLEKWHTKKVEFFVGSKPWAPDPLDFPGWSRG